MFKQLFTAAAALCSATVFAATIPGLYNTGAGLNAGAQDTNYTFSVLSGTATTTGYGIVTPNSGFPFPIWAANDSVSKWLTPSAQAGQSYDPNAGGSYKYTTTFDLTGLDANTASFSARALADNSVKIYLNGNLLATSGNNAFTSWTAFNASASSFVAGVNTLEFVVTNNPDKTGNPTGLRVEFTQSAVTAVPEPQTYALMLAGLVAVGFMARRRRED